MRHDAGIPPRHLGRGLCLWCHSWHVVASPPCQTWSQAMCRPNGPHPLRGAAYPPGAAWADACSGRASLSSKCFSGGYIRAGREGSAGRPVPSNGSSGRAAGARVAHHFGAQTWRCRRRWGRLQRLAAKRPASVPPEPAVLPCPRSRLPRLSPLAAGSPRTRRAGTPLPLAPISGGGTALNLPA